MAQNLTLIISFETDRALTYGPRWTDGMSQLIGSLKIATGGFDNRHGGNVDQGHWIRFVVPPVAAELFRIDPDAFRKLAISDFYVREYGLRNIRIEAAQQQG